MSRLNTARERLDKAVSRLEKALEGLDGSDGTDASALKGELSAVRRDYVKLSKAADQVEQRLDKAIGQLKLVLEP
jgi:predicted  nucleic acid-binding Zn-ribbon protein